MASTWRIQCPWICCGKFFSSGKFYFSFVSNALAYINVPKNKRRIKITWDKYLTTTYKPLQGKKCKILWYHRCCSAKRHRHVQNVQDHDCLLLFRLQRNNYFWATTLQLFSYVLRKWAIQMWSINMDYVGFTDRHPYISPHQRKHTLNFVDLETLKWGRETNLHGQLLGPQK